jgi:hypothetical protein
VQRIGNGRLGFKFNKYTTVKKGTETLARRNRHVMIAIGANVQSIFKLTVEQHRAALSTFGPQIVWCFAARKQRIDPWADIVGNPVHGRKVPLLLFSNYNYFAAS